ncbi:MAG TPA: RNA methyltransferase [Trichocoleus sp.]
MLTSLQNPLAKHIRKLHQAKGRRTQGQFLLEGTHLVQEALLAQYPLEIACCTPAWESRYPDLFNVLTAHAARLEHVSPELLAAIATTVNPDGVIAVAPRRDQTPAPASLTLGLAVETLQDPGNLGTLIRSATAVAADGLWLSADSVDPEHPKVLRASAGEWFRLPLIASPDLATQIGLWRQQGVQVLGTSAQGEINYWDVDFCQPTMILLGNEGAGLSQGLQQQVSQQVKIPMSPAVESLNVAIAGTLLLYEALRQRQQRAH